jgi:hypothetical protein
MHRNTQQTDMTKVRDKKIMRREIKKNEREEDRHKNQ